MCDRIWASVEEGRQHSCLAVEGGICQLCWKCHATQSRCLGNECRRESPFECVYCRCMPTIQHNAKILWSSSLFSLVANASGVGEAVHA